MRKHRNDSSAPDLFGMLTVVEPTHQEVVAREVRKIRVDTYCGCGCGRWMIAGEETNVPDDSRFDGPLALPCAVRYGYFTPRERRPR